MERCSESGGKEPEDAMARLYRDRVDSAADWIWDIDVDGVYTFSNCAVETILGYTPPEIVGKSFTALLTPEDISKCQAVLTEAIRTKQPVRNVLYRCIARDGNPETLESSLVPVVQDGELTGFRGISRDIVGELIYQRTAREALANYLALLENSPTGIMVVQGDIVVYRNPRMRESYGYSAEELADKALFELVHPDDREQLLDTYRRSMAGEPTAPVMRFRAITKSGETRWLEVRTVVITYNGAPAYLYNATDVTEQKLAEDAIAAADCRLTEQQAAIIELTEKTHLASDDLEAAFREITETAARALKVERVGIWLYRDNNTRIVCADLFELSKGLHSSSGELRVEDCPKYFAAVAGRRVVAHDVSNGMFTEKFEETYLRPNRITSMVDAMVRIHGQPVAIVCFEQVGPRRAWMSDEVSFAYGIANLAALAIETRMHTEAEESLRESEARFRVLFERSPDMVVVLKNNRFIEANPATFETIGRRPEEVIGLTPWDISPERQPDGQSSDMLAARHITRALENGPQTFSWVHCRADGTLVDCEVSLAAYAVDEDTFVQAILRDVSERKRTEDEKLAYREHLEQQKRDFYRQTILSVTEGKLTICDCSDVATYVSQAEMERDLLDAKDVPAARHDVEAFCFRHGLEGERLSLFVSGVGEAMTNAVKHGVNGRAYAGRMNGEVWVAVADRGRGIEHVVLPRVAVERGYSTQGTLGLGFSIMLEVADRVLLATGPNGTTVMLVKAVVEPPPAMSVEPIFEMLDGASEETQGSP